MVIILAKYLVRCDQIWWNFSDIFIWWQENKIFGCNFAPIHQKKLEIPFGHPLFISYWEWTSYTQNDHEIVFELWHFTNMIKTKKCQPLKSAICSCFINPNK